MDWIDKKAALIVGNWKHSLQDEPMTVESAIAQAMQDAFYKGMIHSTAPKDRVFIYGTDGCNECETGRITIYAHCKKCIDCAPESYGIKANK